MRAIVQRVSRAKVTVSETITGEIGPGLLVLLGISKQDSTSDADRLLAKVLNLRIFDDEQGKMNLSLIDSGGEMLVVSQFTLYGDTHRGRRPSFIEAAPPGMAHDLYEYFVRSAIKDLGTVQTGEFQAMMSVELVNDGPVTLIVES